MKNKAVSLRILALMIIAVGVVLLAVVVFLVTGGMFASPAGEIVLPEEISGLPMIGKTTGAAAISEINRMHGLDFPFISGAIGVYGAGEQATLWVSGLDGKDEAAQMVIAMRDRIAAGNSPFYPLDAWQDGDRMVYELQGLGQQHYYFQSDRLVVWLAVESTAVDDALAEIRSFYP